MKVSASSSIPCKGRGSHWGYATSLWEVTLIDKNYAQGSWGSRFLEDSPGQAHELSLSLVCVVLWEKFCIQSTVPTPGPAGGFVIHISERSFPL